MPPTPANPLHSLHEQAEASFLPYGPDLEIVESYGEIEAEYAALRRGAGLMDSPHRAVVVLTGKDRLAFLHNKLTNDTARLAPGTGCYAYLLNLKGRITLDLVVLQAEDATLVELDTRLVQGFVAAMEKFIFIEDVQILDASQQLGRLSLMGPQARALLQKVVGSPIENLVEPFCHSQRSIGQATVTIFRQDLAGEPGYELIVPRDQLVALWQILQEAGNGHENPESGLHLRAIGWSAFNIARIEAGTPLFGIDITENYLPMETGPWYQRAVSLTKGCYLGQEIVARMHAHKTVARMLVGMRVESSKLPLAGTEIFDGTQQVGIITSSTLSPMLGNVPIAMGYVKKAYAAAGKEVAVLAEGGREKAVIKELPLWKR